MNNTVNPEAPTTDQSDRPEPPFGWGPERPALRRPFEDRMLAGVAAGLTSTPRSGALRRNYASKSMVQTVARDQAGALRKTDLPPRSDLDSRNSPCEWGRWPGGPDGVRKADMIPA